MPVRKELVMQLVVRMMNESPQERPTASECLEHPWLVEDDASASKRHRSPTSSVDVAPPSKRTMHKTSSSIVSGKGSTQLLVDLLFSDSQNLTVETTSSRSMAGPGHPRHITPPEISNFNSIKVDIGPRNRLDFTSQFHDGRSLSGSIVGQNTYNALSIDHNIPGGLNDHMQTAIENMLNGARSFDQSTGSDYLDIIGLDARLDPPRSVGLGQLEGDMQSNQWQIDFHLRHVSQVDEPGPTLHQLPIIRVSQEDVVLDVSSHAGELDASQSTVFSMASSGSSSCIHKGITYPSELEDVTASLSQVVEE